MTKRLLAIPAVTLLVGILSGLGWSGTALAGGASEITFQISDARAYAYKASIAQPVIQAAPKCTDDPKADKYHCDGYDHHKNCPSKVAFGATKEPADPQPPANVDGISGGAGDSAGNDPSGTGVPQSSAVRLNRLLSLGALGHVGAVEQSNGLASLQYVELGTPPYDEEGHTESDAFTNQNNYEERCYPTKKDAGGDDYAHFFSHSFQTPETVHYSECFETQCQFNAGPLTPTAEHGVTQTHVALTGGVVRGVMSAQLEGLKFPGDFFEIDELQSYATFESDGTPGGLKWQVVSTAQGAHLGGQPISIPQGQSIEIGAGDQAMSVGMAGPYVSAPKDGTQLSIVAPGMFVATSQQTAFFAGIEVTANFGTGSAAPVFPPPVTPKGNPPSTGGGATSTGVGSAPSGGTVNPAFPSGGGGAATGTTGSGPLPAAEEQFALISKQDPPWAPISVLALGTLGLLVVFLRWAQQFAWGRRMYQQQPLRSFEWLYRAFLKT